MEMLTADEVATSAGVCTETVRRAKRRGALLPIRTVGRADLYAPTAIDIIKTSQRHPKARTLIDSAKAASFIGQCD